MLNKNAVLFNKIVSYLTFVKYLRYRSTLKKNTLEAVGYGE